MSDDTEYCSNCKKDVSSRNFVIHSVFCQRNIKICEKCEEPVPFIKMEEHETEMHAIVPCEKCSRMMERWKLEEEHESLCIKRPIACQYCELECPWDEIKDHESYCGARTEECPKCKEFVLKKNKAIHAQNYCVDSKTKVISKGFFCNNCELVVEDNIEVHRRLCGGSVTDLFNKLNRGNRSKTSDLLEVEAQLSKLSVSKDVSEKNSQNNKVSNSMEKNLTAHDSLFKSKISVNTDPKYSFKDKNARYEKNRMLMNQTNSENADNTRNEVPGYSNGKYKVVDEDGFVMCPLCEINFQPELIDCHVNACGKRLQKCLMCGEQVLFSELKEHQKFCAKKPHGATQRGAISRHSFKDKNVEDQRNRMLINQANVEQTDNTKNKASGYSSGKSKIVDELGFAMCPLCENTFEAKLINYHVIECGKRKEKCLMCEERILVSELKKHQEFCSKEPHGAPQLGSRRRENDFSCSEDCLAMCTACLKQVPFNEIDRHSAACDPEGTDICIVCHEKFLTSDIKAHQAACFRNPPSSVQLGPQLTTVQSSSRPSIVGWRENKEASNSGHFIECPYCEKNIHFSFFNAHQVHCDKAFRDCGICDQSVKLSEYEEHQKMCIANHSMKEGSKRSKKDFSYIKDCSAMCPTCEKHIPFKEIDHHLVECGGKMTEIRMSRHMEVSTSDSKAHQSACFQSSEIKRLLPASPEQLEWEKNQKAPKMMRFTQCQFCKVTILFSEFEAHMAAKHKVEVHNEVTKCDETFETCNICDQRVKLSEYEKHRVNCIANEHASIRKGEAQKDYRTVRTNVEGKFWGEVGKVKETFNKDQGTCTCLFCMKKVSNDEYSKHSARCCNELRTCVICSREMQAWKMESHIPKCSGILEGQNTSIQQDNQKRPMSKKEKKNLKRNAATRNEWQNRQGAAEKFPPHQGGSNFVAPVMLPCEFCEKTFPMEELIEHQSGCRPELLHFPKAAGGIVHAPQAIGEIVHISQPPDGTVHAVEPADGIVHVPQAVGEVVHTAQLPDGTVYAAQPADEEYFSAPESFDDGESAKRKRRNVRRGVRDDNADEITPGEFLDSHDKVVLVAPSVGNEFIVPHVPISLKGSITSGVTRTESHIISPNTREAQLNTYKNLTVHVSGEKRKVLDEKEQKFEFDQYYGKDAKYNFLEQSAQKDKLYEKSVVTKEMNARPGKNYLTKAAEKKTSNKFQPLADSDDEASTSCSPQVTKKKIPERSPDTHILNQGARPKKEKSPKKNKVKSKSKGKRK